MAKITYPIIIVNLELLKDTIGEEGLEIAKVCENIAKKTGICVAITPQLPFLTQTVEAVDIPVFSPLIDEKLVLAQALKEIGIKGVLINYSRQVSLTEIELANREAKLRKLTTIIDANNTVVGMASAAIEPDAISIAPLGLIPNKASISEEPEVIKETIRAIKMDYPRVKVLLRAGIKNGKDSYELIRCGGDGIIFNSIVFQTDDSEEFLLEIADGFLQAINARSIK